MTAKARPPLAEIKARLHRALIQSCGLDLYTGEALAWHLLNGKKSTKPGRQAHCRRGRWPSVDHFSGVESPDFRICSGLVNAAKGALSHAHFVALCRRVTDVESAMEAGGVVPRARADRLDRLMAASVHRIECQPTAPSPLNRATSSAEKPSSSSTASVSVPAGTVARGVSAGDAE